MEEKFKKLKADEEIIMRRVSPSFKYSFKIDKETEVRESHVNFLIASGHIIEMEGKKITDKEVEAARKPVVEKKEVKE